MSASLGDELRAAKAEELSRRRAGRVGCPRCGHVGGHGMVHVRHDNGGGHNEPCPAGQAERDRDLARLMATLVGYTDREGAACLDDPQARAQVWGYIERARQVLA